MSPNYLSMHVNQKRHCRLSILYSNMCWALVGKTIKEMKFAEIGCPYTLLHLGLSALKAIVVLNIQTQALTQIFYRVSFCFQ